MNNLLITTYVVLIPILITCIATIVFSIYFIYHRHKLELRFRKIENEICKLYGLTYDEVAHGASLYVRICDIERNFKDNTINKYDCAKARKIAVDKQKMALDASRKVIEDIFGEHKYKVY